MSVRSVDVEVEKLALTVAEHLVTRCASIFSTTDCDMGIAFLILNYEISFNAHQEPPNFLDFLVGLLARSVICEVT
jgi:hypothetical protein